MHATEATARPGLGKGFFFPNVFERCGKGKSAAAVEHTAQNIVQLTLMPLSPGKSVIPGDGY
jgi:hypothetical protein